MVSRALWWGPYGVAGTHNFRRRSLTLIGHRLQPGAKQAHVDAAHPEVEDVSPQQVEGCAMEGDFRTTLRNQGGGWRRGMGPVAKPTEDVWTKRAASDKRARIRSSGVSEMMENAASVAHVCEALANARPSPFLPVCPADVLFSLIAHTMLLAATLFKGRFFGLLFSEMCAIFWQRSESLLLCTRTYKRTHMHESTQAHKRARECTYNLIEMREMHTSSFSFHGGPGPDQNTQRETPPKKIPPLKIKLLKHQRAQLPKGPSSGDPFLPNLFPLPPWRVSDCSRRFSRTVMLAEAVHSSR